MRMEYADMLDELTTWIDDEDKRAICKQMGLNSSENHHQMTCDILSEMFRDRRFHPFYLVSNTNVTIPSTASHCIFAVCSGTMRSYLNNIYTQREKYLQLWVREMMMETVDTVNAMLNTRQSTIITRVLERNSRSYISEVRNLFMEEAMAKARSRLNHGFFPKEMKIKTPKTKVQWKVLPTEDECGICFEWKKQENFVHFDECRHGICQECTSKLICRRQRNEVLQCPYCRVYSNALSMSYFVSYVEPSRRNQGSP
jgi:hypothetical protein